MLQLIFIYNARKNILSKTFDFAHKIISPKTYTCKLCALTYGNLAMRKKWQNFIENSETEIVFLYKEEWLQSPWYFETALPVVLKKEKDALPKIFISMQELQQIKNENELIRKIKEKSGK